MKSVCLAVPPIDETYPWRAAAEGLRMLDLEVQIGVHLDADFLVTWSPWNGSRRAALQAHYKAAGKPVLVMENGWLSPLLIQGRPTPYYQIARDGWNGTGWFQADGPSRRRSWGLVEFPWVERRDGVVLICGQRGHPSDPRTSEPGWLESFTPEGVAPEKTLRRARESRHPLRDHLKLASEVHVWTSNAASWAVMAGVPVVQHGPNLMVTAMASRPGAPLYRGDRGLELERLAWAQWSEAEIVTGEPFARLVA